MNLSVQKLELKEIELEVHELLLLLQVEHLLRNRNYIRKLVKEIIIIFVIYDSSDSEMSFTGILCF